MSCQHTHAEIFKEDNTNDIPWVKISRQTHRQNIHLNFLLTSRP